ncbi:MAG: ribosome maturation factor RimP [Endomicrobium sp.]|jgi:ribosome maturation factor RimP|nr:ribosome maturation factor RimP [Endomicrobium sp.]
MNKAQEIEDFLTPVATREKVEIVDVQYVKENGDWVVRVFIDKDNGITMSECENMSHIFGAFLDESDILKESYVLEISSPGFNRVLKKEETFKHFIGSKVKIHTFNAINNQKNFLGTLLDFKDGKAKINDVTNGTIEIEFLNIKKANVEL